MASEGFICENGYLQDWINCYDRLDLLKPCGMVLTPWGQTVKNAKSEAKSMKTDGLAHKQALDLLAKRNGFVDWATAAKEFLEFFYLDENPNALYAIRQCPAVNVDDLRIETSRGVIWYAKNNPLVIKFSAVNIRDERQLYESILEKMDFRIVCHITHRADCVLMNVVFEPDMRFNDMGSLPNDWFCFEAFPIMTNFAFKEKNPQWGIWCVNDSIQARSIKNWSKDERNFYQSGNDKHLIWLELAKLGMAAFNQTEFWFFSSSQVRMTHTLGTLQASLAQPVKSVKVKGEYMQCMFRELGKKACEAVLVIGNSQQTPTYLHCTTNPLTGLIRATYLCTDDLLGDEVCVDSYLFKISTGEIKKDKQFLNGNVIYFGDWTGFMEYDTNDSVLYVDGKEETYAVPCELNQLAISHAEADALFKLKKIEIEKIDEYGDLTGIKTGDKAFYSGELFRLSSNLNSDEFVLNCSDLSKPKYIID